MSEASDPYPLPLSAIIVPLLAFPAWVLCLPPLIWQYSQRNIAAWSLIVWIILGNFFVSINALIWPRGNLLEWWDGNVLCDIQVHFKVGESVALAACIAMIMRKLALVMDTRNITVAPSKSSVVREKVFEVVCCWGYPALLMALYYIVQTQRYIITQTSGCATIFDSSWPSIVLIIMWSTITICVAAYYASLLIYRLQRYRREFHRLISARNTTKSRFIRLFLISMLIIIFLLPYSFFTLYKNAEQVTDDYSWDAVHGSTWNSAIKVPTGGVVRFDTWIHITQGYLVFIIFGTGADAYNTYKRILCTIGLGKVFPSLYIITESGSSTPSSLTFARSWVSAYTNKAKSAFSRKSSVTETLPTRCDSIPTSTATSNTPKNMSLNVIPTNEPFIQQPQLSHEPTMRTKQYFLGRVFTRRRGKHPLLPLFTKKSTEQTTGTEKSSPTNTQSTSISAHAWASDSPTTVHIGDPTAGISGVHVVHEVRQDEKRMRKEEEGEV
ncbi:pheromone A receptor-domain-containing protein [Dendryphion nanum]|uniref:Pheromone A receptor-domain-containing protein n=1 Tax=Dendryphion nanum TaxID=256645 RepID=A0A9P9DPA4_9PLEO|nr:pheromone A receptor-domain-containing protein [Dendryphion nanum]